MTGPVTAPPEGGFSIAANACLSNVAVFWGQLELSAFCTVGLDIWAVCGGAGGSGGGGGGVLRDDDSLVWFESYAALLFPYWLPYLLEFP